MRLLSFLARVSFICNVFFILCLIIKYTHIVLPKGLDGFVIIVGWILSVILNVAVNALLVTFLLKKNYQPIGIWINIFNLFCFLFQVVYFLL